MMEKSAVNRIVKGKNIAAVIFIALLLSSTIIAYAQSNADNAKIGEYIASQPLDSRLAAELMDILRRAESDDQKLMMEITRRVDYYFYVSTKIDRLMDIYAQTLIPFIYQRDLFQGSASKGRPAILESPAINEILNFFIRILQPFYVLAVLTTAVYLLFVSGSPSGRAKAKSTLIKLIIGLGVITLTIPIMETLLELSHYISSSIIAIPSSQGLPVGPDMFVASKEFFIKYFLRISFFDVLMGLPFLAAFMILPIGVLMILSIRYFMVLLLTVSFPFTILLYSFMATKRIGRTLVNQIILWVFLPIAYSIIIVVGWTAYKSTEYISGISPTAVSDVTAFISLSGFILLLIAPYMAYRGLKWVDSLNLVTYIIRKRANAGQTYVENECVEEDVRDDEEVGNKNET